MVLPSLGTWWSTGSRFGRHFAGGSKLHGLAPRGVHGHAVLAPVALEADVGLPLALQVALLGGDPPGAAEEAVAAEVLVALLHEAEAGLVPDQAVVQQLLERGVDVALALEQLVPPGDAVAFKAPRKQSPPPALIIG